MSGFGGAHPHSPNEGATDEWWTPPEVFEAIGLEFDLDPCAPPNGDAPWLPVKRRYTRPQNGLILPWEGRIWLNPPYGREAGHWVQRLAEHGHGIALVFSRTDVKWWHAAVPSATAVCLIQGRLTFIAGAGQSAPGNSGGPSALIAYGEDCAEAVARSGLGLTYLRGEHLMGEGIEIRRTPSLANDQPYLAEGPGVRVVDIVDRYRAGDSAMEIAKDFGIRLESVRLLGEVAEAIEPEGTGGITAVPCPTCGGACKVISGDEGTSHFKPLRSEEGSG